MYTNIRQGLRHVRKAWPGTLVDPCLLSGYKSPLSQITVLSTGFPLHIGLIQVPFSAFECDKSPSLTCFVQYRPPSSLPIKSPFPLSLAKVRTSPEPEF